MSKHKSMLMSYINKKHKSGEAAALAALSAFLLLVIVISVLGASASGYVSALENYYPMYDGAWASSGMAVGSGTAIGLLLVFALAFLAPIELVLREKKSRA
jgi:hypothetical protein